MLWRIAIPVMSKFSRNSKFLVGGNRFENFGFSFHSIIMGWCFKTKSRSASQQKPVDWSRRVLAIGGIFFDPRSIFDLVIAGQRSIFGHFLGRIEVFHISESILAKLWKIATWDFHGVFLGHFSTKPHAFWSIFLVIVAAYRLESCKVTSAPRHRLRSVAR